MFSTTTESWASAGLNRGDGEPPETLDGDLAVESGCNLAVGIPSAAVHSAQGFGQETWGTAETQHDGFGFFLITLLLRTSLTTSVDDGIGQASHARHLS